VGVKEIFLKRKSITRGIPLQWEIELRGRENSGGGTHHPGTGPTKKPDGGENRKAMSVCESDRLKESAQGGGKIKEENNSRKS